MKTKILFCLFLITLSHYQIIKSLKAQATTLGLVAYYPFNGNANDASGNAHHATINGATLSTDRFGIANKAYSFNGVNNYMTVPHHAAFNFSSYTISVWFKYNGVGPSGKAIWTILSKNDGGSGNEDPFQIWMVASNKHPGGRIGNGVMNIEYSNPPAVNDGQWHQAVSVFNNSGNKLFQYIDGTFISANTFNNNPFTNTSPINFGRWASYQNYFNGNIDDVRFYNRALSFEEVSNLYQTENPVTNYQFMTVKCFIEGYHNSPTTMQNVLYNAGIETTPSNHTDSIKIEIISPFGFSVYFFKGILLTNGNIQFGYPSTLPAGNYTFYIHHRNTLLTYEQQIPLTVGSTYDFTNKTYLYQQNTSPGVYSLYSGDLNKDYNIDLLDASTLETDLLNFSYGYFSSDLNGDGNTDLLDLAILEKNINDFIGFGN